MNAEIIDNELLDAILETVDVDQSHHVRRVGAVAVFAYAFIINPVRER